jgi:hypothetical protein
MEKENFVDQFKKIIENNPEILNDTETYDMLVNEYMSTYNDLTESDKKLFAYPSAN